jgi:hypothetical protein
LGTCVLPCGQVNEQDHGQAEQADEGDDAPEAPPLFQYSQYSDDGREQRQRHKQVGVRLAGVFGADRGRDGRRQAGVGGLTDLDAAVGDELRDDETGGGGDDDDADRSRRRQTGADPSRRPHPCVPEAPQQAFAP